MFTSFCLLLSNTRPNKSLSDLSFWKWGLFYCLRQATKKLILLFFANGRKNHFPGFAARPEPNPDAPLFRMFRKIGVFFLWPNTMGAKTKPGPEAQMLKISSRKLGMQGHLTWKGYFRVSHLLRRSVQTQDVTSWDKNLLVGQLSAKIKLFYRSEDELCCSSKPLSTQQHAPLRMQKGESWALIPANRDARSSQ